MPPCKSLKLSGKTCRTSKTQAQFIPEPEKARNVKKCRKNHCSFYGVCGSLRQFIQEASSHCRWKSSGFHLFFWWKMCSGSSSRNVKSKFKPTDNRLMFFIYILWSFEPSLEELQQWLTVPPALWDTLPCESVILILQLVDETDQGVLQVSHLTDERLQGQLQLLLLSLKKGKTDKGWGQSLHPWPKDSSFCCSPRFLLSSCPSATSSC